MSLPQVSMKIPTPTPKKREFAPKRNLSFFFSLEEKSSKIRLI